LNEKSERPGKGGELDMSLSKKLLVSALIAAAVVIVVSTVVIAMPHMDGWNSPAIPANSQQGSYSYNQGGGYSYGYGGYGYGGCMGGGASARSGIYGGGMGYSPNGVVETHWSYILLDVDGEAIDVYGPSWFWHIINPATGSNVEVIGELVSIINWYGETQTEITPFELTIEDITYGNGNLGIPIWNQRDI
jgi:hypothetical protein